MPEMNLISLCIWGFLSLCICITSSTAKGRAVMQNLCLKMKFNTEQTDAVLNSLRYHLWVWGLALVLLIITACMYMSNNLWHVLRSDTWEFMAFSTMCVISLLRGMLIGWTIVLVLMYCIGIYARKP